MIPRDYYIILVAGTMPEIWEDGQIRLYDSADDALGYCTSSDVVVSERYYREHIQNN